MPRYTVHRTEAPDSAPQTHLDNLEGWGSLRLCDEFWLMEVDG